MNKFYLQQKFCLQQNTIKAFCLDHGISLGSSCITQSAAGSQKYGSFLFNEVFQQIKLNDLFKNSKGLLLTGSFGSLKIGDPILEITLNPFVDLKNWGVVRSIQQKLEVVDPLESDP